MLLARFHDQAEKERARSLAEGMRQRQDLIRTRDAVVFGLAKLADSRDPETGDHLERISVYSTMLATVLRQHPRYNKQVTPAFVRLIGISSALHDIGKVGVEDEILRKPGALTSGERVRMQAHPLIGGDCLREIEQRLGSSNFLQMAREIALAHHERWDGSGYPHGLRGEEIPLAARIVAIADVYDALSSRRVYKDPRAHDECVEIIRNAAGTQFDPDLVDAWLTIAPKFAEVSQRYCAFEAARSGHTAEEGIVSGPSVSQEAEQLAPAEVG
jgi:response regulator RpfG family c-di-GMP phosphodiesterase